MLHADEGALHAYLDGALDELPSGEAAAIREHLAACPECAARLEEEQRIREEAIEILSGPLLAQIDLPPFEELRLRAEATSPPKVSRGSRLYRLGWAASVVLAIGAGWSLRGGQSTSATPEQPAASRELLDNALGRSGVSADLVASSIGDGAPSVAERVRLALLQEVSFEEVEAMDAAAVNAVTMDVAAMDVAAVSVATMDFAVLEAATLQQRLERELTPPSLAAKALVDLRASAASASRLRGTFPAVRVTAMPVANEETRDEIRDEFAPQAGRAVVTSASRLTAGGAFSNREALERRRGRGDSGRRGGDEGPLVVPEFEVIVVEAIEQGAAAGGTRALQWLTEADTLELLHLPEGVGPSDLEPLRDDGIAELVVLRDGLWLVMRARRRSVQELEGLLERLDANR